MIALSQLKALDLLGLILIAFCKTQNGFLQFLRKAPRSKISSVLIRPYRASVSLVRSYSICEIPACVVTAIFSLVLYKMHR